MTDNGALDGITDYTGDKRRSTRVAKWLAASPTTTPATTTVVYFAAGTAGGLASLAAT